MTKKSRIKSKALEAVHETALDLFKAGAIDKRILREYDLLCLTESIAPLSPKGIKKTRGKGQGS